MDTAATAIASGAPGIAELQRIQHDPDVSQAEKIEHASRQFEAILLRQFLGDALKPFGSQQSGASAQYQSIIVDSLAGELSRGGQFGFASSLQAQLCAANPTSTMP